MSYAPPTFEQARDQLLDVLRNKLPGADVSPASENYARACLAAGAATLICYGVSYVERQIFPDTADTSNLERHAKLYGRDRKQATAADNTGAVRLTGTNATVVAAGLSCVHEDGTEYLTTAGGVIADEELTVAAVAVTKGAVGNKRAGDELTVQSPPAGVNAVATIAGDFSGGTDIETNVALALWVLARMQAGNAGGTAADYESWATSIDGIISADCLKRRRGAGTVSVAVYTEGADGIRVPANADKRAEVLAYIETKRPITASEIDVPEITEVELDLEVQVLEYDPGYDEAAVRAAAVAAVKAAIYAIRTGGTAYWVMLNRTIASVDGLRDYDLLAPVDNTTAAVDASTVEVLIPGTVTVNDA